MPYQYVREPLTADESDRLSNACETSTGRLVVWTLLDTGLRVGELCGLTAKDVLWQQRSASSRCRTACERSWSITAHERRRSRSRRGGLRTSSRRWLTARGSPRP